jgi:hypothetical protein
VGIFYFHVRIEDHSHALTEDPTRPLYVRPLDNEQKTRGTNKEPFLKEKPDEQMATYLLE